MHVDALPFRIAGILCVAQCVHVLLRFTMHDKHAARHVLWMDFAAMVVATAATLEESRANAKEYAVASAVACFLGWIGCSLGFGGFFVGILYTIFAGRFFPRKLIAGLTVLTLSMYTTRVDGSCNVGGLLSNLVGICVGLLVGYAVYGGLVRLRAHSPEF